MQVVFGVVCHKHREKAGIFFRIWVIYITFLEVHLKGSSILTPPMTDFIRRNYTIVPGELIHTIREYGSTLWLARAVSPTNTNFRLTFLLIRLQEALYEDLAV